MKRFAREEGEEINANEVQELFTNVVSEMVTALDLQAGQTPLATLIERCWKFEESQLDSVLSAVGDRILAELECFAPIREGEHPGNSGNDPIVSQELLERVCRTVDELGAGPFGTGRRFTGVSIYSVFEYTIQFPYETADIDWCRTPVRRRMRLPLLDNMLVYALPQPSALQNISVSPDCERIALNSASGSLVWLKLVEGKFTANVAEDVFSTEHGVSLSWTPSGLQLFTLQKGEMHTWDDNSHNRLGIKLDERYTCISGFLDEEHVVLGHHDAAFVVLDLRWPAIPPSTSRLDALPDSHLTQRLGHGYGHSVSLCPTYDTIDDDVKIIACHSLGFVIVTNLEKTVEQIIRLVGCEHISVLDGGRSFIVTGGQVCGIEFAESDDGPAESFPDYRATHTCIESPGGGRLVQVQYRLGCTIQATAVSPDSRWFAVAGDFCLIPGVGSIPDTGSDAIIRIWDAQTNKPVCVLSGVIQSPITCVSFSPNSVYVFAGDSDGRVMAWNLEPVLCRDYPIDTDDCNGGIEIVEDTPPAHTQHSVEIDKPANQVLSKPHQRSKKREEWTCGSRGCDEIVSAAMANVDKDLSFEGHRRYHETISPHDYCPECYWELVTGEPHPKWWELPGRRRQGHGIDNVQPGKYGPSDDTSPGDENVTRRREGD